MENITLQSFLVIAVGLSSIIGTIVMIVRSNPRAKDGERMAGIEKSQENTTREFRDKITGMNKKMNVMNQVIETIRDNHLEHLKEDRNELRVGQARVEEKLEILMNK